MDLGRKMLTHGLGHDVRFTSVTIMQVCEVLFVFSRGKGLGHDMLKEVGGAEIVIALEAMNYLEDPLWQQCKADSDAGCKRLAVSAGIENAVRRSLHGQAGGVICSVKTKFAISCVFQE